MNNLTKLSPEIFLANQPIANIGCDEIEFLKREVVNSPKGRVRINMHQNRDDLLHEMFIAIKSGSYIRPHRHRNKSESFHVVFGIVDVVIFDEIGNITNIIKLAANDPSRPFYYRLSDALYHTLLIYSDILVVHEITNGPFKEVDADYATFSPIDTNSAACGMYMQEIKRKVDSFRGLS